METNIIVKEYDSINEFIKDEGIEHIVISEVDIAKNKIKELTKRLLDLEQECCFFQVQAGG